MAPNKTTVYMDLAIGQQHAGRLVIELFVDACPKTCENFRALCTGERGVTKGGKRLHYRGSRLHRIIRGFMAQGGDITNNDGTGGESIYGERFPDEAFTLRHDEPGLLSMANCGPNTNSSQFFITFAAAPHLDNRHVVFGKVVEGREVLTVLERVTTGANDRPRMPVIIEDCGQIGLDDEGEDFPAVSSAAASTSTTAAGRAAAAAAAGADRDGRDADEEGGEEPEREDGDYAAEGGGEEEEEEEEEAAVAKPSAEELGKMSATQRRLFELRLKLNAGRKANRQEVKEEYRRFDSKRESAAERAKEKAEAKIAWDEELKRKGLTPEQSFMLESADKAGRQAARRDKKEQNKESFGWDIFNRDSLFRGYEKRLGSLPQSAAGGGGGGGGASAEAPDPARYGESGPVNKGALDRMANELKAREEGRKKFSRRRETVEGADVDYINDRNEHFNKKIKRAFDKYTVEIRQNLERGTAL